MPRKMRTDLAISHMETSRLWRVEPEPVREDGQVEPAEHREHDDLEHRVDRHQHGGQLAAAVGEVVPDEDHRDAAGEAHDDQPGAQLGQVGEEHPGQGEHEQRADHPVQDQGEPEARGSASSSPMRR